MEQMTTSEAVFGALVLVLLSLMAAIWAELHGHHKTAKLLVGVACLLAVPHWLVLLSLVL